MSRFAALAIALPLAACGRDAPAPVEQAAVPAPAPAAVAETPVAVAERLVRTRAGEGVRFAAAEVKDAEAAIVCGAYEQAGDRHRYIAVGGEFAFVEPAMKPGEMDRAFAEFCGTA